jgi:pimeloyl-ACP methyl ester carboxylesterase
MSTEKSITWARGYTSRQEGEIPGTYCARYRLTDLLANGFIDSANGRNFLLQAGLSEFAWEVTWTDDYDTPNEEMDSRFAEGQGYVIFIHGWTGNHTIWESLPALLVANNRRLISISIDHNGFGQSLLVDETPCSICVAKNSPK